MRPFQRIRALYRAEPEEMPFSAYLKYHLEHGVVVATADFFLMALSVNKGDLERGTPPLIASLHVGQSYDCWYVSAYSGDIEKGWAAMPWFLPWFAYERGKPGKKRLRIWPTGRIRAKLAA